MKLREAIIKAANEAETRPSFIGQAWAELFVGSLEAKGFAIVPKEATEEMLDGTWRRCALRKNSIATIYHRLLAARPTIED
jgi:hypothetical protein